MPRLEGPAVDQINESEARQAHATRLRDRRAQYVDKLSKIEPGPRTHQERSLIQEAIALIDEQQKDLDARGPVKLAANDQQVSQLKDEVASLREALTEATLKLQKKADGGKS